MPTIPIHSIDDPRIAAYRDLPRSNLTRISGRFITEGLHLVVRLLESDYEVESVLASDAACDGVAELVPEHIPLYVAGKRELDRILGFQFHRGVLACGRRRSPPTLEAVWPPETTRNAEPDL